MCRRQGDETIRYLWLTLFIVAFVWSGVQPVDRFTWFLEVIPAVIALGFLAATYRSFPLTGLAYLTILVHCLILMVGGHYTYAEVPLFDYAAEILGSSRNNYDKIGHFAQGFVPALIAREIIVRKQIIDNNNWRSFFIICFCLALSAFYEIVEWWVAVAAGEGADAFLGTQGYAWDTQSDMAAALIGAICSLLFLSRIHDRQLNALSRSSSAHPAVGSR